VQRVALDVLSRAYEGLLAAHARALHGSRAPIATVCVGSVVAGGSGKTPVAEAVAALARAASGGALQPHVVCRGYGGHERGPLRVVRTRHEAAAVGDEALLHAAAGPTWVARRRLAGVRAAAAAGAELAVLDDGLQHRRLLPDLSLLVVRAQAAHARRSPLGNCRLLPAGPLRERPASALRRVDAIVILDDEASAPEGLAQLPSPLAAASAAQLATLGAAVCARAPSAAARAAEVELLSHCAPGQPLPMVLHARLRPTPAARRELAGASVVAFSASASPDSFAATLRALVGEARNVRALYSYPDHAELPEAELRWLLGEARAHGAALVATAKDVARLPRWARGLVRPLDVRVEWEAASAVWLAARLLELPRLRVTRKPLAR
jgi:tetraacyldisaccharide 4'-kinase